MTRTPATRQIASAQLEGFILAGGRSSRFGTDKALAVWQGTPLLVHAAESLRVLGLTPRIVGRDPLPYLEHARVFVMSERLDLGPLEGLRVALRSASHELALVLSADMPLIREGHLTKLINSTTHAAGPPSDTANTQAPGESRDTAEPQAPVVFFSTDSLRHPFPGIYPRSVLPVIESLPTGSSIQALLDRVPLRELTADADIASALRGVNTPEDLRGLTGSKTS